MGHAGKDELKRADSECVMGRNSHVVLTALARGQTHMAADLARHVITAKPEPTREVLPRYVPRQLHGVMVSSRTTFTNRSLIASGCVHSSA